MTQEATQEQSVQQQQPAAAPSEDSFAVAAKLLQELSNQLKAAGLSPKAATVAFGEGNGRTGLVTSNMVEPPPGVIPGPEHALNASLQLIHGLATGLVGEQGANDVVGYLNIRISQGRFFQMPQQEATQLN